MFIPTWTGIAWDSCWRFFKEPLVTQPPAPREFKLIRGKDMSCTSLLQAGVNEQMWEVLHGFTDFHFLPNKSSNGLKWRTLLNCWTLATFPQLSRALVRFFLWIRRSLLISHWPWWTIIELSRNLLKSNEIGSQVEVKYWSCWLVNTYGVKNSWVAPGI